MRCAEIDRRPLRYDPGRIDRWVTRVIVPLDLREVDGLRDARDLIQLAQIVPQIRIVDDAPQIAFEMTVIDRVEAHQRGEQAPVSLGDTSAGDVARMRETLLSFVERGE